MTRANTLASLASSLLVKEARLKQRPWMPRSEDLKGLIADDTRWGHIANGERLPIDQAPIIREDDLSGIVDKLKPVKGQPLTFTAPNQKWSIQPSWCWSLFIAFTMHGI